MSIPIEQNPPYDIDGRYCGLKQRDPHVWFLAGTFGSIAERTCTVPSGKSLLLPVVNYECSFADEPNIFSENELKMNCRREIEIIKKAEVAIDGTKFDIKTLARIHTRLFNITLPVRNVLKISGRQTQMVCDGYWILSKLKRGLHRIESIGSCRNGTISIAVNYDILVS